MSAVAPTGAAGADPSATAAAHRIPAAGAATETTISLPGGVPLVLRRIPAGSFQMGSPTTERSRNFNEGPQHTVAFKRDYYLGRYEITQRQWIAVMGTNPSLFQPPTHPQNLDLPVEQITWDMVCDPAAGFLKRLNDWLEETGQGPGNLRLPSEAQWEYACRGGTTTRYYFGDSLLDVEDGFDGDGPTDGPAGALPGNRSDYEWFIANAQGDAGGTTGTQTVGAKRPNAFGLFDMNGNAWEWCQDWYHSSYANAPTDGSAWMVLDPNIPNHIVRGGSWANNASYSRSAYRVAGNPLLRHGNHGFRLARPIPEPAQAHPAGWTALQ